MNIKMAENTPIAIRPIVANTLDILAAIGIPITGTERRLERMAKACMAVAGIVTDFSEAKSLEDGHSLRTRDIISFENKHYGESISPGSYDDIRRLDLRLLTEAGIVLNTSETERQATNNPSRGYGLSASFASLLHAYGTTRWNAALAAFSKDTRTLKEAMEKRRNLMKVPVTLPKGKRIELSYGEHNSLQKAVIETFLPLFGLGAEVLYVGDTADKFLHIEKEELERLKFFPLEHEELPDVIAYSREKDLLYLIEAFHSTGEWNELRVRRVREKLQKAGCTAEVVFFTFTAFENRDAFRRKAKDIAWETEVWIADTPEHLVHFNGSKYLELHK